MKICIIVALLLTLVACVSKDRELPTNESGGSDDMRLSPCVCLELDDYDGSGFVWAS